jgi:prepilin-type N-terminal cleavage/methylation domain-containing protein
MKKNQHGYTLIEVLVAIVAAAMIFVALAFAYVGVHFLSKIW